jgi:hypothetical protein
MNWRFELAIVLVFTLAFVGLGLMMATPVDSAPPSLIHFSQGKPRHRSHRRVLGHPGRGKRRSGGLVFRSTDRLL